MKNKIRVGGKLLLIGLLTTIVRIIGQLPFSDNIMRKSSEVFFRAFFIKNIRGNIGDGQQIFTEYSLTYYVFSIE